MKPAFLFLFVCLVYFVVSIPAFAQQASPQLIPFQGRLTDQQGRGYTNGQFTLIFNLYGQAVGGTPSWTERHQAVGVINGMINVFLGSITTLGGQDFSNTKHLGITIDADNNQNTTDPEMIPRQMIIPAFWAKNSEKLAGYDWSAMLVGGNNNPATGKIAGSKIESGGITSLQLAIGSVTTGILGVGVVTSNQLAPEAVNSSKLASGAVTTTTIANAAVGNNQIALGAIGLQHLSQSAASVLVPPGTINAYAGGSIPTGWLLCNGQTVSRTTYSNLWAAVGQNWGQGDGATTFNIPDLQGLFLRGVDNAAGRDPDKASRSAQNLGGNPGNQVGSVQQEDLKSHTHTGLIYGGTELANGGSGSRLMVGNITATGGNETRPKNAYVNYIIKY